MFFVKKRFIILIVFVQLKTRPALRILPEGTLEAKYRLYNSPKIAKKWPLRPAYRTDMVNQHFLHTQIRPAIFIVTSKQIDQFFHTTTGFLFHILTISGYYSLIMREESIIILASRIKNTKEERFFAQKIEILKQTLAHF